MQTDLNYFAGKVNNSKVPRLKGLEDAQLHKLARLSNAAGDTAAAEADVKTAMASIDALAKSVL